MDGGGGYCFDPQTISYKFYWGVTKKCSNIHAFEKKKNSKRKIKKVS
jgi:lysozyme family protein